MVAFALKTVFALFTFFAVANCDCRYTGIISGAALQLHTQEDCEGSEFQTITVKRMYDDPCVCQRVATSVGKNVKTLVFEPGVINPAYFTLFSAKGCHGKLPPPAVSFGGKEIVNLPEVGYSMIGSVEICGHEILGPGAKEPKPPAKPPAQTAEEKAKAKNTKAIHKSGIEGVWNEVKGDTKHVLANTKDGLKKIATGHITKTAVEDTALGVGVGAGIVGALALAPLAGAVAL
ncbi:hypothetical protein BJ138DRAFT_441271 [Hygrophoropsis aurantiaca]|uniref:Uncharacterized protein n=1 Tax=Hygrophoropsis aurantiaca TaxID=72124 RepID=A0ACB8A3Y8_9AGAM|nr:hypothetical protein BJ138DRAFT_441271 [Hygrophoropsis aurantiaca]